MNFRRIKRIILASAVLCLVAVSAAFGFWMQRFLSTPAGKTDMPAKVFAIAPGQGLGVIAENLYHERLITDPFRFKLYARYKGTATQLKAGEYLLPPSLTPSALLSLLVSGKVRLHRLTLPEGFNLEEIAERVETAWICPKEAFLSLCRDPELINELGLPVSTLEGYLFPDTYLYPKSTTCKQMIVSMTDRFKRVFTDAWKQRARELGYSVHEIVTLASIIEKETGDARERPLISSVFHNRLKRGMRLESDPTVIYGVDDYDGRIRYRHLRRLTPYNTYQIPGLPAGPIANPGAKAIEAALYPAQTDFLFFVSKNDGTHKFSETLAEHNRAVQKYQLGR